MNKQPTVSDYLPGEDLAVEELPGAPIPVPPNPSTTADAGKGAAGSAERSDGKDGGAADERPVIDPNDQRYSRGEPVHVREAPEGKVLHGNVVKDMPVTDAASPSNPSAVGEDG